MCKETDKILWQTVCSGKGFACHALTNNKVSGKTLISMGFGLGSLPWGIVHCRTSRCFWLCLQPPQWMYLDFILYFFFLSLSLIIFIIPFEPFLISLLASSLTWTEFWFSVTNEIKMLGIKTNKCFYPPAIIAWSLANPCWPLYAPDIIHSWSNYGLLQFNYGVFQYTTQHGAK